VVGHRHAHAIDAVEVSDLLALTCRVGSFQYDPSLMRAYYEMLSRLMGKGSSAASDWQFLRRAVLAGETQDPALWSFLQGAVIDGCTRFAVRRWLEQDQPPRPGDLAGVRRLLFAASPLSRVMLRHRRPLLEIYRAKGQLEDTLAQRHILPMPRIVFTAQEGRAYEQLEAYCRGLAAQMARHGTPRSRSAMGFLLSFLRLRFASSLFAIRETVRRRLERVEATLAGMLPLDVPEPEAAGVEALQEEDEDDHAATLTHLQQRSPEDLQWECLQLRGLSRTLKDLSGTSSKMNPLLHALQQRRLGDSGRFRQTVIFTRFYDTLCDLVRRLQRVAPEALIGTYSGQGGQYWEATSHRLIGVELDEIKHRFLRGEIDILCCTDAAAEGLNFQSADLMINFDLPWNPMKIEQRIGRIDRIGQRHRDISVLNLCYADSAEEIVYGRLLKRLDEAGSIVGTQQLSLLPVTPEEFAQLADRTLSAEALQRQAMKWAEAARQRTDSMEIAPPELFQIYERWAEQAHHAPAPVDLPAIWQVLCESTYLQQLGCRRHGEAHAQVMTLMNIPGIADGTAVTTSRATFEVGLVGFEGRLHFATYGDPAFEAILQQVETFPLPECVRRLEIEIPDIPATVVGYAVAETAAHCRSHGRLVTSWDDLVTVQLDAAGLLDEP
jgi:hypothetical protein